MVLPRVDESLSAAYSVVDDLHSPGQFSDDVPGLLILVELSLHLRLNVREGFLREFATAKRTNFAQEVQRLARVPGFT